MHTEQRACLNDELFSKQFLTAIFCFNRLINSHLCLERNSSHEQIFQMNEASKNRVLSSNPLCCKSHTVK